MASKRDVLQAVSFGEQVAEDERNQLPAYFVRTIEAERLFDGSIDIVYAPKGAGKSALYVFLLTAQQEFEQRGILVIPCEHPLGEPVFRDYVNELARYSQLDFQDLWSLYFTQLVAFEFRRRGFSDPDARKVIDELVVKKLLPNEFSLRSFLHSALAFLKALGKPRTVETTLDIDPTTGLPRGITGKVTLSDSPDTEQALLRGSVSALLSRAENVLAKNRVSVWLALDRLDAAFRDNPRLEETALRALFRVYLDLKQYAHIRPKIFLRSDIWERITKEHGFAEASHVTRGQVPSFV